AADRPRAYVRARPDLLVPRAGRLALGAVADRDPRRYRRDLSLLRPAPVRGRLLGDGRALELRRRGAEGKFIPQAARFLPLLQRQHRAPPRPPPERQDPQLPPAACPRRERDLRRRAGARLLRRRPLAAAEADRPRGRPTGDMAGGPGGRLPIAVPPARSLR